MERLVKDLVAMIAHVKSLPGNPSSAQLQQKVTSLNVALEKDSVSLPKRIQEIIREGFANMGWESRRRVVTNSSAFTLVGLLRTLETILEEVSNWSPPVDPTDSELSNISNACNRLWELDVHRLVPNKDYVINVQGGKYASDRYDAASEALFTFVDAKVLERPTFASFIALLDNYIAATGASEEVTTQELKENRKFLNLIMDTAVMQYAHRYLLLTKKTKAADRAAFIEELDSLWFGLYSRKARNDSSGFEHVFVGEIKEENREIIGFHNWIQLYLEEKKGNFDYQGYIKPRRKGHSSAASATLEQFITLQFTWNGALKPVSSSFIGTSPEFEVALYTLCFYNASKEVVAQVGPYKCLITCYTWPSEPRPGQKKYIATSFPGEAPLEEDEAARRIQLKARARNSQRSK